MTTVVVGGHSRKVGKTSVAEGLIRAFKEYPWTAIKISSHWHGAHAFPRQGDDNRAYSMLEETDRAGNSDTSRFLAAGAVRSLWVRVRENGLAEAMNGLKPVLRSSPFVVMESNGVLRFLRPDIYIAVLRYDVEDFKDSARETLRQADAAITIGAGAYSPSWTEMAHRALAHVPKFAASDLLNMPEDFFEWVRLRLPRRLDEKNNPDAQR